MNFHKIKQYTLFELFIIVLYKLMYKLSLALELLRIRLNQPCFLDNTYNFDKFKLSEFSAFFNECSKTDKKIIIREADDIINGNITIFNCKFRFNHENDWLKDPLGNGYWDDRVFFVKAKIFHKGFNDVKYVLELNKLNHLVRVALAYYLTLEEKYINYIDKSIIGFVKCVPFERSVVNKIIMDISFRSINLIQISLLCWNNTYFVNNIYPNIHSLLIGYEKQMRKFNTPRWFKTGNGVNHNTGEMTGLIITQLWLSLFGVKNYKKHLNKEFSYLHDVLDRTIAPSGAYLEQSANYTRVVLEFLIIFELFLNELYLKDKKTKYYFSKQYKERLLNYLQDLSHEGNLPNFGDNDNARVLWAFIRDVNDYSYLGIMPNTNGDFNKRPSVVKKYLDGSQWIFNSNDNNKIWMFTRVGKFAYLKEGTSLHVHNDILALLLSVNGQEVFIDRGTSFYNSGRKHRLLDIGTSSHNTVYVNGMEMADILPIGFRNYPVSVLLNEPDYLFSAFINYKSITHKRKINYFKNEIIIFDEIHSESNAVNCELSFLLAENIFIKKAEENQVILSTKNKKSFMEIYFEGIIALNIVETEYYPTYSEKRSTKAIHCLFNCNSEKQIITNISLNI